MMRVSCDRDRIRTCDRLLRRQMLYPAELLILKARSDSNSMNCQISANNEFKVP
jgi:hypothetical protein